MKFTKFGKAFLVGALSVGVVFGISSCVVSYTVGYLYVTGTETAQPAGEGIISGYRIDHNTGSLTTIDGLPVPSGGSNPVRAVLLPGSTFLYVLNRGVNAAGNSNCTTAAPCQNANITQFAVGGNGILTAQQTFYTQGLNPSGSFWTLGQLSSRPRSRLPVQRPALEFDQSEPELHSRSWLRRDTCGDITILSIASTTGRLSLVQNQQVSAAGGSQPLTYFPVPANPVDFLMSAGTVLTMNAAAATTQTYPYVGGHSVFPYAYNTSNGQLTLSLNSSQNLGINQGTAIVNAASAMYVLDNEAPSPNPTGAVSQILPYTIGTNGALQPETSGIIPDDPTLANPIYVLQESKGKFFYVANQGNNTLGVNAQSGIAGYFLTTSPAFQATFIAGEPFGSGAGPQCIVEDPSSQFVYTANYNDSSITGRTVDVNSGVLDNLRNTNRYILPVRLRGA